MRKYRRKTVDDFVNYLASLGLKVYGPCPHGGCMDYDVAAILERQKRITAGRKL